MNKQQAHGPFSGTAEAFFQSANSYKEVLQRMCAPQSDIVFFDFETTGIDKSQHPDSPEWCGFPVQIGMVRVQGGERVGQFMEFMNPGKPLSDWCRKNLRDSDGNLLTDAWLASKRPYDEVLRDALNFLGDSCIVGGQNCTFDVGVMRHSLQRMGELERWKVTGHVDSLFISQAVLSGQSGAPPSFGLENLNRYFGLPAFAAHDAAEDSFASWLVLRAALQRGQSMQEQGAWGRAPALPPLLTPNVTLSDEQTHLQQLALEGRSMFITGGAGTGKSFLLASIVTNMQLQRGKQSCVVLSPTGAAAVLVKGRTIHSFFSLGIPKTWSCFDAVQTGRNSAWLKHRLTCIIFDEISMVSAEMLDLLDVNIRAARSKPDQPFGGLQVLMFGDFFQLPPIVAKQTAEATSERVFSNAGLAFESHFWKQLQPQLFNLKRSFRQQDDQLFLDALQRIRVGDLNARDRELLCAPKAPNPSTHAAAVVPTKLFCHREKVDNANNDELAKLPGHLVTYTAHDSKSIVFEMQPPAVLHLKIGAQVMLVKNLDVQQGLVNGSRGVVVAFQPVVSAPPHEQSDAQAQLATDIERMSLQGDVQQSVEASVSLHPVVRFDCVEQLQIMAPLAFEFDENEFGKCSFRRQVPLTLAWAISIHKAQGMSISNLEVDCQGAWADGQVYVALSRGRSLRGLTVHSLGVDGCCKADPKVLAFYAACEEDASQRLHATTWADDSTIESMRQAANSRSSSLRPKAPADGGGETSHTSGGKNSGNLQFSSVDSPASPPPRAVGGIGGARHSPTREFNGNPDGPKKVDGSPDMRYAANFDPKFSLGRK